MQKSLPPYDLLDTAEKWRRCSVASHPTKTLSRTDLPLRRKVQTWMVGFHGA
jgi:hypothetical protein